MKAGNMIEFLEIVLLIILLLAAAAVVVIFIMRRRNAKRTRITSEHGIQESTCIKFGGINQYIHIRGENTGNPVILFLHGGPGGAMSFVGYHWQTALEPDYTIVNWDQRGCGRTFYGNPAPKNERKSSSGNPAPVSSRELSAELLLRDIDELVEYLKERFGQEKIILMGHSWGTILGSMYSQSHPEKLAAYIGVGQAVNMESGEALAKETAILRAESRKNLKYIDKLSALYDIFFSARGADMKNFIKMRSLTSRYLLCKGGMRGWKMAWTGLTSPDISFRDLRWQILSITRKQKFFALQAPLLPYLFDFNLYAFGTGYEIPVSFISGDGDWITPYPLVRKYAKSVKAPKKDMILLENTGHTPFLDNPKEFCTAVRKVLK